jgi:hypothetical protein
MRYDKEIDSAGKAQFGLAAEMWKKANPDLMVRDKAYSQFCEGSVLPRSLPAAGSVGQPMQSLAGETVLFMVT